MDIAGGRVYDVVTGGMCGRGESGRAAHLQRRHFDPAPEGVAIIEPESS